MQHFRRQLDLPVSADDLWSWHARADAFDRLVPPWLDVEVTERYARLEDGAVLEFQVRRGPFTIRWRARHEDVRPGEGFVDVQERGPFAHWRHQHSFEQHPEDPHRSRLVDDVEYRLPLHAVSRPLVGWLVRRDLERMFDWRHRVTRDALSDEAARAAEGRTAT